MVGAREPWVSGTDAPFPSWACAGAAVMAGNGLVRSGPEPIAGGGVLITAGKDLTDLLDSLNLALKEMRADGALAALDSRRFA